jgi:hypothetical protein
MLNLTMYAYYDRDLAEEIRLKEVFGAGLTYIWPKK